MSNAIEVTTNNFNENVLSSSGFVLVDFWASWCAPCKMMGPVIDALTEKYTGKITVYKLNTDENPELSAKYQITAIPTLILFKAGKDIERILGFKPQETIEAILENHIQAQASACAT